LLRIVSTLDVKDGSVNDVSDFADTLLTTLATASGAGGGEFYTTPDISALLVGIVDPEAGKRIYDPACGTGGLLLAAYRHTQTKDEHDSNTEIFGQDINVQTASIARLNALLHGVPRPVIDSSDSLVRPLTQTLGKRFDFALSNPPSGLKHSDPVLADLRQTSADFHYGPPTRVADFNFIQRVLGSLNDDGRAALLINLRPLFIQGQEGEIRQRLVESDVIESVIILPDKLLPQTNVASAVLFLNKKKSIGSKAPNSIHQCSRTVPN